jgi:very-short-patch-repair endonuclease
MVYANGHKLKSIRAFFDGARRASGASADDSGRVERFYFCDKCGFAANTPRNECPRCHAALTHADIALVDSFEAEENTQITSAEDSRQRVLYRRAENLLDSEGSEATIFPYEFVSLEFRPRARLLVSNWGRQSRRDDAGEKFELCPTCGRHRPHGLTEKRLETWDTNHANICTGTPRPFILGYEFAADVLVLSVPAAIAPPGKDAAKAFCRTLGQALVVGAQEVLEIEPDEIAYFQHTDGAGGWTLVFYETAPGGAGYLEKLAADLRSWAAAAQERLYNHDCERACYRCLKSARNQFDHGLLDKEAVRSVLFQLAEAQETGERRTGRAGEGREGSAQWLRAEAEARYENTPIEQALLGAIRDAGRLPEPVAQYRVTDGGGSVLTVPDFAYPERKIAIYCDGFAYHGDRDALESDARRRNQLQADGWAVLTFWGRQILRNSAACEAQIARCYEHRRTASQPRAA